MFGLNVRPHWTTANWATGTCLCGHSSNRLTHWGRVTHICVGNLAIIGSDNGLSPGRRQAITYTNVGILLIGPLPTNFSEMLIKIHTFSFKKIHLKMSSGKWRPSCLGLNVLTHYPPTYHQDLWYPVNPSPKWPPFRQQYFQMQFVNEKLCILIKISLKFGLIDNNPTLV